MNNNSQTESLETLKQVRKEIYPHLSGYDSSDEIAFRLMGNTYGDKLLKLNNESPQEYRKRFNGFWKEFTTIEK